MLKHIIRNPEYLSVGRYTDLKPYYILLQFIASLVGNPG